MKHPINTFLEAKARRARRRFVNQMWHKHQLREEHQTMFGRRWLEPDSTESGEPRLQL